MTIKETKQALFRRLTIRNLTLNVVCILIVLFGISWTVRYFWRYLDYEITNYRETQISNIYIGQEVRIRVDAIEGRTFTGRVSAISEATGSKYSLVPTDNSAGNFVKVQQRIPVRIDLVDVSDEDMAQLRAGMMVITEALKR